MEDLEVDCCPYGNQDSKQRLQSGRFDSGYKSGESLNSFNLKSEGVDGRFASDEDNLIPFSDDIQEGVEKLTLQQSDKDEVRFDSKDEGYQSTFKSDEIESIKTEIQESENEGESDLDERQLECVFTPDEDGDTQLHLSIIHVVEAMSLYFISIVPDWSLLNIRNNYLQTPLHLAVITKQPLLARKLMTSGAKVDVRDHKGNTPLHIASKEGDLLTARVLMEPISFEETKDLKYKMPYQAIPQNLEARNYEGQVCVHLAAEGCHIEVLSVLLSKGANINARDGKSGRTILHYAAESGNMQMLEFLLSYNNIDINATTYAGLTPIMLASGRYHNNVVSLLREKGACYDSDDSTEEDMEEDYDDIRIGGRPVNNHTG